MSRQFLTGAAATTVALTALATTPSLGAANAGEGANTAQLPAVAEAAPAPLSVDPLGQQVNYRAAADKEQFFTPARNFKISARFGDAGFRWSTGYHTGLDFVGALGSPIYAAADGTVVSAKPEGAYGNMVKIKHADGSRTLYAHLTSFSVKKGDTVERGQRIGSLGSTGNSSGPHLHFEVNRDGKPVNPELFLEL